MDTFDPRLTPTGDLKVLVRARAVAILGGDPDLHLEVERAMSEIPVDWDNLPEDGPFLARLIGHVADAVRIQQELAFSS